VALEEIFVPPIRTTIICAYYSCSRFQNTKIVLRIRDARAVMGRMGTK